VSRPSRTISALTHLEHAGLVKRELEAAEPWWELADDLSLLG
jgi:hypothetical protein